jgi:hypothetical protein
MSIKSLIDFMVVMSTDYLIGAMLVVFALSITARILIWWTVKREYWFSVEFEKRIERYMNCTDKVENLSFFSISKRLLEITYYEIFEVRSIMKRRNPDVIMDWMDRVFLIQQGCARTVNDILRKIRFMKSDGETPSFLGLSRSVLQNNPCFNRMFGIVPMSGLNDLLNILPSLFIVGGIFGTFLGVMSALPELGGMDLANSDSSKAIMDAFLMKISFSMSTSIAGIVLSVTMTIINTFFSADKVSVNTIETLTESMETLWSISDHNLQDGTEPEFDGTKDPLLVLAEDSIVEELNVKPGFIKLTRPIQGWWLKKNDKDGESEAGETPKAVEETITSEADRRSTGFVSKETSTDAAKIMKAEVTPPVEAKSTTTDATAEKIESEKVEIETKTVESEVENKEIENKDVEKKDVGNDTESDSIQIVA